MKTGFVTHSNGPPAKCWDAPHSRCISFWNAVRSYHINHNGWSDIAYSWGVCPHGARFTGRGWDKNQFAGGGDQKPDDLAYRDADWYSCLFFVGDDEPVSEAMKDAFLLLRGEALLSSKAGTRVIPHNKFRFKRCPGPVLTAFADSLDGKQNPAPAPPPAPIIDYGVFDMSTAQTKLVPVGPLGADGRGWNEAVFAPFSRIISAVPNGPYPPADGYWPLPSSVSAQARGTNAVVTVQGGWPGSTVNVWVTVS